MKIIRSTAFFLCLCLITPPFSLLAILICWMPANIRYHAIGQWNLSVIFLLKWICGIEHKVIGLENLSVQPFILCSNHQSTWETLSFYGIFPTLSFVTKRSLLWIPFFGWGFYLGMDPIAIVRDQKISSFKSILNKGKKKLANNISIAIFPEGTRLAIGERKDFLPSAFMLAVKTNVPVVPVAVNSGTCWPRGLKGFFKSPGLITVSIGKPISVEGKKTRTVCDEAQQWIHQELEVIGG